MSGILQEYSGLEVSEYVLVQPHGQHSFWFVSSSAVVNTVEYHYRNNESLPGTTELCVRERRKERKCDGRKWVVKELECQLRSFIHSFIHTFPRAGIPERRLDKDSNQEWMMTWAKAALTEMERRAPIWKIFLRHQCTGSGDSWWETWETEKWKSTCDFHNG